MRRTSRHLKKGLVQWQILFYNLQRLNQQSNDKYITDTFSFITEVFKPSQLTIHFYKAMRFNESKSSFLYMITHNSYINALISEPMMAKQIIHPENITLPLCYLSKENPCYHSYINHSLLQNMRDTMPDYTKA